MRPSARPAASTPTPVRTPGLAWILAAALVLPAAGAHAQGPTPEPTTAGQAPAQVVIVGTFHFDNPGLDMHNVESVDVLTPERQAEIAAITDALARFRPTVVAVEWPAAVTDQRYASYRAGELAPSANEVVQLGFRLAAGQDLERVHGIDVSGEFPFEPVATWAQANGQGDTLAKAQATIGALVAELGRLQRVHPIGEVLHMINAPDYIAAGQAFYMDLLRFGAGDDQPGAELNAAWARRNFMICARLLQSLKPGDRAVVFYGQGHAHALRRCAIEASGVELVEANDYLPRPTARR